MSVQKVEDVIKDVLKDDAQKNALDFIAYLRANDIPVEESDNYWEIKYKDKCVCFIFIDGSDEKPGPWTIWSDQESGTWITWSVEDNSSERENFSVDDHIKELAWANVNFCASCGGECSPGKSKTILGKVFDNLCNSAIAFTNPDAEALDCAKNMVDIRISDILKNI